MTQLTLTPRTRDRLRHVVRLGLLWFLYGRSVEPDSDDIRRVALAARCRTCHGDGFVCVGDTTIRCDECDGGGYYWWLL
jgi:hypothetical protein